MGHILENKEKKQKTIKRVCFNEIVWLIIMKMKQEVGDNLGACVLSIQVVLEKNQNHKSID